MGKPFTLSALWNAKFLEERKRNELTGEVLALQTTEAVARIEAVTVFQTTLIESVERYIEAVKQNKTPNVDMHEGRIAGLRDAMFLIKNITPKGTQSNNQLQDAVKDHAKKG